MTTLKSDFAKLVESLGFVEKVTALLDECDTIPPLDWPLLLTVYTHNPDVKAAAKLAARSKSEWKQLVENFADPVYVMKHKFYAHLHTNGLLNEFNRLLALDYDTAEDSETVNDQFFSSTSFDLWLDSGFDWINSSINVYVWKAANESWKQIVKEYFDSKKSEEELLYSTLMARVTKTKYISEQKKTVIRIFINMLLLKGDLLFYVNTAFAWSNDPIDAAVDFFEKTRVQNFLSMAFSWRNTTKGYYYWEMFSFVWVARWIRNDS